jgi:hypothetical protein
MPFNAKGARWSQQPLLTLNHSPMLPEDQALVAPLHDADASPVVP